MIAKGKPTMGISNNKMKADIAKIGKTTIKAKIAMRSNFSNFPVIEKSYLDLRNSYI